jgi:hypothetical protein
MRYGVALALLVGLLALPASAGRQTETVTVKVGQTIPLKTVFDKKTTYTIVVSGLVKLRLNDGSGAEWYDPFHGAQGPNCEQSGVGVYLQIKDARGATINASDAYKPPVYTIPCRSDHRYSFPLNDAYPPAWDIQGKAQAYIPLQPDPAYWTASGSFKLTIEPAEPEPVAVIRFGVNAKEEKNAVATAFLEGRGLMTTDQIKEGALADTARLVPEQALNGEFPHAEYVYEGLQRRRVEVEVTSGQLVVQGEGANERISVRLIVEVVDSNKPGCTERTKTRRGARGTMTLIDYPRGAPDSFVNAFLDLPCGVDEAWKDADSDVTIRVNRLKKK